MFYLLSSLTSSLANTGDAAMIKRYSSIELQL